MSLKLCKKQCLIYLLYTVFIFDNYVCMTIMYTCVNKHYNNF